SLQFRYTIDGLLAYRADGRENVFEHEYDELGRRVETLVSGDPQHAPIVLPHLEGDLVSLIEYAYNARGQLTEVTAFGGDALDVIASSSFEYDGLGNLRKEHQSHGEAFDGMVGGTPHIQYDWSMSPANGFGGPGGNY